MAKTHLDLLDLAFEGGAVLDVVAEHQREELANRIRRKRFKWVSLRGLRGPKRRKLVQRLTDEFAPKTVLVRGFSGAQQAASMFPKAQLIIDYWGKGPEPRKGELIPYGYRTKRIFIYAPNADPLIRDAGLGRITAFAGPYFPRLDLEQPDKLAVGILDTYHGMMDVLPILKRLRKERGWDMDILAPVKMPGVVRVDDVLSLAEQSTFLICPHETPDLHGPHEGAILALGTGRALCTTYTSALHSLPYGDGQYMAATRYTPSTYATSVELFLTHRSKYEAAAKRAAITSDDIVEEIMELI